MPVSPSVFNMPCVVKVPHGCIHYSFFYQYDLASPPFLMYIFAFYFFLSSFIALCTNKHIIQVVFFPSKVQELTLASFANVL